MDKLKMSGIEVIASDLTKNPRCPHGPTLLFSRIFDKEKRNFFVCSACRDRKDCSFFLWEEDLKKVDDTKRNLWRKSNERFLANFNPKQLEATLEEVKKRSQLDRAYCKICNCFVLNDDGHLNHSIAKGISDQDLLYPSKFLAPADKAKREAQYLFTSTAVETIVGIIKQLKIKNVICVGAPRIHEHIINNEGNMRSILLDIDQRYGNFYGSKQFCLYNMFNNHFFLPQSKTIFEDYLKSCDENVLMIADPPFGGRIEPLADTIRSIWKWHGSDFPVFFIFPYFMEAHIRNDLPQFKMCDYKVDYDNHRLFRDGPGGRKQGSPVRIFTNVDLSRIELPADEGYKHCDSCNVWVSIANRHCSKCGSCTSKDGRTYVHCDRCGKCAKPTWRHCDTCERCALVGHKCERIEFVQKCFHCNADGHKRANCPQKRKGDDGSSRKAKKSKRNK